MSHTAPIAFSPTPPPYLPAEKAITTKCAGVAISPPQDANNWYVKKGCPLEGMMVYDDEADKLKVDQEIFSKLLSNTDVAGAYLHEAIYKHYRKMKDAESSVESRKLTACLLSKSNCINAQSFGDALKEMAASDRGYVERCTFRTVATWDHPAEVVEFYQRSSLPERWAHPEVLFKSILGRTFNSAAYGSIANIQSAPGSGVRLGSVSIRGLDAYGYLPYSIRFFNDGDNNPDRHTRDGALVVRDNDHPESYTFRDGFRNLVEAKCVTERIF